MTTVIKNATIVTGDSGRTILYDSAIAIDGDRIVGIGPTPEVVDAHSNAEQIEGSGKAVF
ncbi:MAG TPA: amidohydrolase, partial [Dehalococcoidia bacterium]|nr:amidohydrolase [Dehalococcoidia bacterium]